jgi:hypothetical protein
VNADEHLADSLRTDDASLLVAARQATCTLMSMCGKSGMLNPCATLSLLVGSSIPATPRPTPALRELIDALDTEAAWLRDDWWTAPKTDTKAITRRLEGHLPPSSSPTGGPYRLRQGWNLETREHYVKMPGAVALHFNVWTVEPLKYDHLLWHRRSSLPFLFLQKGEGGGGELAYSWKGSRAPKREQYGGKERT